MVYFARGEPQLALSKALDLVASADDARKAARALGLHSNPSTRKKRQCGSTLCSSQKTRHCASISYPDHRRKRTARSKRPR